MLRGLDIRDMLIIDRLELEFQPGLNVLTGETGAGKSILLDSLGFVLGWRGRADLVRQGADQGEVTASFDLPEGHAAHRVLEEAGLPGGPELLLRRVNTADGRKTAWINDRRASGEVLRALSETLIELHGQHDDRGLLNPRGHLALLDAYMARPDLIAATRDAWRARREAHRALDQARAALEEVKAEEDFLRHAVGELDKLDPQPGEDEALDARRRLMQSASKVREDITRAAQALGGDGAEGLMTDALRRLEDASDHAGDRLEAALAALSRALTELGEASDGVERALDELDFDPMELEQTEERLFAIRALSRKHGIVADDLPAFAETLRERLARLDGGADNLAALEKSAKAAAAAYDAASGGELSRFLLALKVCLRGERADATMIFDEIDRGVGGATADAVGRRLAGLADGGQVLVVTHSPQVAALGAHHWRVAKRVEDGMTLSTVTPLAEDERVDEIARMLSGDRITPEARAAALSLLG